MEQRISLVTLGVSDLARSREFYARLNWRPSVAAAEGVAFFQAGGIGLALYPRLDFARDVGVSLGSDAFPPVALAYNTRDRDEVDAVLAEARAAGASVLKPAKETSRGGYSGYFADPDGFLWEVAWNPGFPVAADGSIRLPE